MPHLRHADFVAVSGDAGHNRAMRTSFSLVLSVLMAANSSRAADPLPDVRLIGLGNDGHDFAVLELRQSRFPPYTTTLHVGDVDPFVAVVAINNAVGKATIKCPPDADAVEAKLPVALDEAPVERVLDLRDAPTTVLLELYQLLSRRTVLRGPTLTDARFTLATTPGQSVADAAAAIIAALDKQQVTLRTHGELFALAVATAQAELLLASPAPPPGGGTFGINSRMMNFQKADLSQVLELYGVLSDRAIVCSPMLPLARMTLKNETAVTRAQGIWMLETHFRLHGIAVVPCGDHLAAIVPVAETNRVPRFEARSSVPGADEKISTNLAGASLEQLLKLYADVTRRPTGKVALNLSPARIDFRSDSLSRRETVQALELIAAVHRLAFVSDADGAVDLGFAAGARQ
jgi:hypothetical protein